MDSVLEFLSSEYAEIIFVVVLLLLSYWAREFKEHYLSAKSDDEIEKNVYRLVLAAEEFLGAGPEKRAWVGKEVRKIFPTLDDNEIDMWINVAVRAMKSNGTEKR